MAVKYLFYLFTAAAAALCGCSVSQDGNPYLYRFSQTGKDNEICLVNEIPEGNDALVMTLRSEVEQKGFRVREVRGDETDGCTRCVRFVLVSVQNRDGSPGIEKAALTFTQQRRNYIYSFTASGTFAEVGLISLVNDNTTVIRQLVDRIFPDPAPWHDDH